ncbi:MAG: hypothetical protein AB2A00_29190 [Myxococcota bacterium]
MDRISRWLAVGVGVGSVALGGVALVRPAQVGRALGLETSSRGGLQLSRVLAVRDVVLGLNILAAGRDPEKLRRGIAFRMAAELSDLVMLTVGRKRVVQPRGRWLALTVFPVVAFEAWVYRRLGAWRR